MKFDIATSWIQYFPSMCFQSLYRAVNQCHLSQICVSLNYMVATNTIITIYAAKFEQTIIHQQVHLRRESQSHEPPHVRMRLYQIDKSLVCLQSERRTLLYNSW
jgi:hypothetical protein